MKVVIFEAEEWEARACRALSGNHELTCVKERLTSDNAARYSDAEVISTFINSRLDAEVLRQFPELRLIATRSTGHDHIDLAWCAAEDIEIANVPDYGDVTVAEHSFALMLAAARGCCIEVSTSGTQADELADAIEALVADKFGEDA